MCSKMNTKPICEVLMLLYLSGILSTINNFTVNAGCGNIENLAKIWSNRCSTTMLENFF